MSETHYPGSFPTALAMDPGRHGVSDQILALLQEVSGKLDLLLARQGPRSQPMVSLDAAKVLERYLELGTMGAVAGELGVSTQRVQQIIAKHEAVTGSKRRPSVKFATPIKRRIRWDCDGGCGLTRLLTPSLAAAAGPRCRACSIRQRHRFSDAEMEEIVAGLKSSGRGRWARLAERLGYPKNGQGAATTMVFGFLYSRGRFQDIGEIWPGGAPHFLVSRLHEIAA